MFLKMSYFPMQSIAELRLPITDLEGIQVSQKERKENDGSSVCEQFRCLGNKQAGFAKGCGKLRRAGRVEAETDVEAELRPA